MKKIYIDGKPFMHFDSEEGAAGNVYHTDVYRGIVNNQCFSFYILNHYAGGAQFDDNNQIEMFFNKMKEIEEEINNKIVQSAVFKIPIVYSDIKPISITSR